ncbi:transcriptional activator protein [Soybean mild mottle virus]|uniref:Transcriptional activator protein n=1 Tax=Soybean mild mottle virus TaxID=761701 RepID=D6MTW2_9GEMI|nr:transcriptional activator protein [Soybean mild mottle virus]ADG36412.1 transcriptional activator protein [Soybean mild mottle virus]
MRSSTPSKSHCSPPNIKAQHRDAKRHRATRRRRIDCPCGCSIYVHLDCTDHGFSHRGVTHTIGTRAWRVYLGGEQSPLFQTPPGRLWGDGSPIRRDEHSNNVQQLCQEEVGDSQMLPGFKDLSPLTESELEIFSSFQVFNDVVLE